MYLSFMSVCSLTYMISQNEVKRKKSHIVQVLDMSMDLFISRTMTTSASLYHCGVLEVDSDQVNGLFALMLLQ